MLNARHFIESILLVHGCVSVDSLVVNYTGRCTLRELVDEFRASNNLLVKSFCYCVQPRAIKLAIVGRPQVDKSNFLDKNVRTDRVLTGPVYVMCVDLALVNYLLP